MVERYARWVIRYRWIIIILSLIATVIAANGAKYLTFNTDYRYFFSEDNPELNAFEELQNTYTKSDNVLFVIAPKDGNVFTPETLAIVEELTLESWQMPFSLRVDSITNFQHTWSDADDLIVEDLVKNAGEMTPAELERAKNIAINEPLLVKRLISPTGAVTGVNVTVNLPGKSITEVPEVAGYAYAKAEELREKYPDIQVYLSGIAIMNNAFSAASQDDFQRLNPIMFLVIIVIMALLLRSFSGTFTTLIVIVLSAATAMGIAGWLKTPLTPMSIIAPNIILTLAVADSIHILITMLHEMRHGQNQARSDSRVLEDQYAARIPNEHNNGNRVFEHELLRRSSLSRPWKYRCNRRYSGLCLLCHAPSGDYIYTSGTGEEEQRGEKRACF